MNLLNLDSMRMMEYENDGVWREVKERQETSLNINFDIELLDFVSWSWGLNSNTI